MAHVAHGLLVGLFVMAMVACGGQSTGYVPVDSPIMKYEPPEPEDLIEDHGGDEGTDGDAAAADEGDDWVDEMEDELKKEEGKDGDPADKAGGK